MFGFSALDLSVGGRHGLWRNLSFSQGSGGKAFGQGSGQKVDGAYS